jgi:hypothetical protein
MYKAYEGPHGQAEQKEKHPNTTVDTSWADLSEGNLYRDSEESLHEETETTLTPDGGIDTENATNNNEVLPDTSWPDMAEGKPFPEEPSVMDSPLSPEVMQNSALITSITDGTYGKSSLMPSAEQMKNSLGAMGTKAKSFFGQMSEKGQSAAAALYEGIGKIPGVQRLTSTLGIAFNQAFINCHENGAANKTEQLQDIATKITAIETDSAKLESAIADLRRLGSPGLEGMERKAIELDEKKIKLLKDKGLVSDKLNSRLEKMESFTRSRDAIADNMIGVYGEKLESAERKVSGLENDREIAETDLETASTMHAQELRKLDQEAEKLKKVAEVYASAGWGLGDIKKMEKRIAEDREKIQKSEAELQKRMDTIAEKIKKAKDRTTPYKAKRDEFTRLKTRSSIEIKPAVTPQEQPAVEKVPEATTPEETKSLSAEHIRSALERGVSIEVKMKSTYGESLDDWIVTGTDGKEVFFKLKGAETIRRAIPLEEAQSLKPEVTSDKTPETTDEEDENLPDILQYLSNEDLFESDEDEHTEALLTLINEDEDVETFLSDFYSVNYTDEERENLAASFTKRFAERDKVIIEDMENLVSEPIVLTHPDTGQKLQIRMNESNHLEVTVIKE